MLSLAIWCICAIFCVWLVYKVARYFFPGLFPSDSNPEGQ